LEKKELVSIKMTLNEALDMMLDNILEMYNCGPGKYEFNSWANNIPADMLLDKEVIHLFIRKVST